MAQDKALRPTITVTQDGNGLASTKNYQLGPRIVDNDYAYYGFNVTVKSPVGTSIKSVIIKQEIALMLKWTIEENGEKGPVYFLTNRNHPKFAQVQEDEWEKTFASWNQGDGEPDWVTLDQEPDGGVIDGSVEKVATTRGELQLGANQFSWTDLPGVKGKSLKYPTLEKLFMYRTFRITAKIPNEGSTVAVFSLKQVIEKINGKWVASDSGVRPKLTKTWP